MDDWRPYQFVLVYHVVSLLLVLQITLFTIEYVIQYQNDISHTLDYTSKVNPLYDRTYDLVIWCKNIAQITLFKIENIDRMIISIRLQSTRHPYMIILIDADNGWYLIYGLDYTTAFFLLLPTPKQPLLLTQYTLVKVIKLL